MLRTTLLAGALALPLAAFAQPTPAPAGAGGMTAPASPAAPATGTMSEAEVGVAPMTGVSAASYVQYAADSDKFEIESAKVALRRSGRDDVKSFARTLIDHHTQSTKTLMGSLKNEQRTIKRPAPRLASENAALVTQLKRADKAQFDNLFLTQQLESHKKAWSLHKGYATSGEDATLRQVAANTVPVIEQHLSQAQRLVPAGLAAN